MTRTKPGPEPLFTRRLQVKIRADQHDALGRVAGLVHMTQADCVRWILDAGLDAIERSHRTVKEDTDGPTS